MVAATGAVQNGSYGSEWPINLKSLFQGLYYSSGRTVLDDLGKNHYILRDLFFLLELS